MTNRQSLVGERLVVCIALTATVGVVLLGLTGWRGAARPRSSIQIKLDELPQHEEVQDSVKIRTTPDNIISSVDELRFIIIGDYGSGGSNDEFPQMAVAKALLNFADTFTPKFVVSTGDQVYPAGIQSADDPQLVEKFENVYGSMKIPWYMVVGNHDCLGSVNAMIEYGKVSPMWTMPERYYSTEYKVGGKLARFIYVDACILVCGQGHNYRCEDQMNRNLGAGKKKRHLIWLDGELERDAHWKIVIAHWPVFSFMGNGPTIELIEMLLPRMIEHKVHVYFNGHDHSLQHIVLRDGNYPQFFVSGGGGYRLHPEGADASLNSHAISKFSKATPGFIAATMNDNSLNLQFIDREQNNIYETTIAHD